MNRNSILSGNTKQYISVKDADMLSMIEKLLPYYKSFNQLANDALQLGLPILLKSKLDNTVQLDEQPRPQQIEVMSMPDERIYEIVRLLQEIVMNTSISKWLLCSLFNAKNSELHDKSVSGQQFEGGAMRDTPSCLAKYEVDMLNEIDGDD